jgi:hypothetical protein
MVDDALSEAKIVAAWAMGSFDTRSHGVPLVGASALAGGALAGGALKGAALGGGTLTGAAVEVV